MGGIPLAQLLEGIVGVLLDMHPARPGPGPEVAEVAILDPDDDFGGFGDNRDGLVLVIGARGRAASPFLRAAARRGAVAVAVKAGPSGEVGELAQSAAEASVALLAVRPEARWDQLAMLLRERLEAAELMSGLDDAEPGKDLFSLAEATALVTGGIVSIEDAGDRVLAYSRSDQDVDELRRLSILGWQGPESYQAMLRAWGVFARLRAGEEVVRVDEHPELGIRPRLAVGIRAGNRYLGTIWVQQRTAGFTEHAEEALVGAARIAATEILRWRHGAGHGRASREDLLTDLLTGRASTDLIAGRLGLDPVSPALVVGFGGPLDPDIPTRALNREQLRNVASVYATAYHRSALVGAIEDRVYAVVPGVPPARVDPALRSWVRDAVGVLRERTGIAVRAGIGLPAPGLAELPRSRAEADRALDALARAERRNDAREVPTTAGIDELRAEILLAETLGLIAGQPELRDPGVALLAEHDADRGTELVVSVLAYLDALGDVAAAAAALHVHPNTLRHRLRRAGALSGIELGDPRQRLACHLQLLLARADSWGPPFVGWSRGAAGRAVGGT